MDRPKNAKGKKARWGLKAKLIVSMLLVGVLPLLVGLVMAFLQGTREIQEVSGMSFEALATEAARKLDLVIRDELTRTSRIASDPLIVSELEKRRDSILELEEQGTRALLKEGGERWEAKDPELTRSLTTGKLAHLLQQYYAGSFLDPGQLLPTVIRAATKALFITDIRGRLVATINTKVPYASAETAWWRGAFNKGVGKPYIENVSFNDNLGTYTFSLSLPMMDSIGYQAIGVLHRELDAKEFFAPSTHPIRFGKTGHVMLIDSDGIVLSCPILPTGARLADVNLIPLVTLLQPGWVKAPSDGHGGQSTSIIGFAALPEISRTTAASTGSAWHTFVWQSSDELFAPVQHLLTWISVFGLVAVGLLATLGYFAASRIVTPIQRLQEAARLIARGELREPISVKTGDEIEDLSDELNRMNTQLEAAFAGLTDQVELKSREVRYLQQTTDEILDTMSSPIIMLDPLAHVQYMNRAAKDAFLRPEIDPNATTLFDLIQLDEPTREKLRVEHESLVTQLDDNRDDPDSDGSQTRLRKARDPLAPQLASAQGPDRKELHVGTRIYRYEWFRISGPTEEGQRFGLVLRDTTDESRLQDQLIQAEKSGSLGVLSAGIGHELNNPIFGILGLGEAIQDEQDLDQAKAYARDIVQHGQRITSIIRDFTGYVRLEGQDRRVDVDVNELLDQALRMVQHSSDGAHLKVEKDYRALPTISAVPDEVRQAFVNVMTNSVQAMQGEGVLFLATETQEGAVKVTIRDSGPGIPKPYLGRVFDPFFTTKGQGQGTGLGLTVVQRIVTKYGGRIQIQSEVGRGTSCFITFPVHASTSSRENSR